jgi:hypothetical protein
MSVIRQTIKIENFSLAYYLGDNSACNEPCPFEPIYICQTFKILTVRIMRKQCPYIRRSVEYKKYRPKHNTCSFQLIQINLQAQIRRTITEFSKEKSHFAKHIVCSGSKGGINGGWGIYPPLRHIIPLRSTLYTSIHSIREI